MDHQEEAIAFERAFAALRWLGSRVRRSLWQVGSPGCRRRARGPNGTAPCTGTSASVPCNPASLENACRSYYYMTLKATVSNSAAAGINTRRCC